LSSDELEPGVVMGRMALLKQNQARLAQAAKGPVLPSDREAVMILVDLIRHPNSGLQQIAHRLKGKGLDLESPRCLSAISSPRRRKRTARAVPIDLSS